MQHFRSWLLLSHPLHFLEPLVVMDRNELLEVITRDNLRIDHELLEEESKVRSLKLEVLLIICVLGSKDERRDSVLRELLDKVLSELDEVLFSSDDSPFEGLGLNRVLNVSKGHEAAGLVLHLGNFNVYMLLAERASFELSHLDYCVKSFQLSFLCLGYFLLSLQFFWIRLLENA
jgi:hypothetical protein